MNAKFSNLLSVTIALAALYFVLAATPVNAQEQKIPRGSKVVVRNDYGSVTITGWERETIEAVATDVSRAGETVSVSISQNLPVSNRILVTAKPDKRNPQGKIRLEVKVPRYIELEPIYISNNNIAVFDMDGSVMAKTDSGEIIVRRAGAINAQTKNGDITAENIKGDITAATGNGNIKINSAEGFVDVTTGNGNVEIREVEGDVKVVAINSKMLVQCAQGDVEISDTSSQIMLLSIGGNVDVSTSNGKANFIGAINRASRYRLKTLSGAVSMSIPDNVGFTATLSSYSGIIEKDFDFKKDSTFRYGKTDRRFIGKYGDGEARIELDSFDGRVSFSKIAAGAIRTCKSENENKNQ
jgi:DUF4097 and DUF4098 domain-containing protein YvlB